MLELDLKALVDQILTAPALPFFQLILILSVALVVIMALRAAVFKRLWRHLEENLFSNWRLLLLGLTGIILSVASGWTTWNGMRNFTQEPVLSLMITIGIQGVMLIVAWLIGETFASGMTARKTAQGDKVEGAWTPALSAMLGIVLFVTLAAWAFNAFSPQQAGTQGLAAAVNWQKLGVAGFFIFIALVAFISLILNRKGDVAQPYLQGSRIIAKNAVLWVMFLACAGTSIFFSYDSLFSNIFPADERKRAADLRAENQVGGLVTQVNQLAARRRIEEADTLFRSATWRDYDQRLNALVRLSQGAEKRIEAFFTDAILQRQRVIAGRQEDLANARGRIAGLDQRKATLLAQAARLEAERASPAAAIKEKQANVSELERAFDEQRVKTLAEERGVEGSGKVGRGRFWREARAKEQDIKSRLEIAQRRLKNHTDRLLTIDRRLSAIKRELAQIDGQLAKLKGSEQTARQLIETAKRNASDPAVAKFDPRGGLTQLERARVAFRQSPNQEGLAQIQRLCTTLTTAMASVSTLEREARAINCDPGPASEAAGPLFALNRGAVALQQRCSGGDSLPKSGEVDTLLQFVKACVQDSGLAASDTAALRRSINAIGLNRDDKAHPFVVTWNAFQDGNKLAYLALGIAIAIDSLVFMSGLFGANAVRSPLANVPQARARTARDLDAIIDAALLGDRGDRYETATLVLEAMQPIDGADGFTSRVMLAAQDSPARRTIVKVLNAAATIGAVQPEADLPGAYNVRSELFEYLSVVARREFERDTTRKTQGDLERTIGVALLPDILAASSTVIGYLRPPAQPAPPWTSELVEADITTPDDRTLVFKVLNAGSAFDKIKREADGSIYRVHRDLYRVLLRHNARAQMSGSALVAGVAPVAVVREPLAAGALSGVAFTGKPDAVGGEGTRQIEDHREARAAAAAAPQQAMAAAMPATAEVGFAEPVADVDRAGAQAQAVPAAMPAGAPDPTVVEQPAVRPVTPPVTTAPVMPAATPAAVTPPAVPQAPVAQASSAVTSASAAASAPHTTEPQQPPLSVAYEAETVAASDPYQARGDDPSFDAFAQGLEAQFAGNAPQALPFGVEDNVLQQLLVATGFEEPYFERLDDPAFCEHVEAAGADILAIQGIHEPRVLAFIETFDAYRSRLRHEAALMPGAAHDAARVEAMLPALIFASQRPWDALFAQIDPLEGPAGEGTLQYAHDAHSLAMLRRLKSELKPLDWAIEESWSALAAALGRFYAHTPRAAHDRHDGGAGLYH
ncbi:MAG: hypothetical protein AAFR04_05960 [Pseudomonadota bacterium]